MILTLFVFFRLINIITTFPPSSVESNVKDCHHAILTLKSSVYATEAGYKPSVHKPVPMKGDKFNDRYKSIYPAPLALPGDELTLDPKCPPQSVRSWQKDKDRNAVTPQRNVIYVATPTGIDKEVDYIGWWARPNFSQQKQSTTSKYYKPSLPDIRDVVSYLAAFYHPLSVDICAVPLAFTSWVDTPAPTKVSSGKERKRKRTTPNPIALRTESSKTQIRTRSPSPDGIFPTQLNLNDVIDFAIDILPTDAYALLLIVSHDLFEDDDDVFVCGRAYGGSRVAVISTARYNPDLDDIHSVDRLHEWPASHCAEYINAIGNPTSSSQPSSRKSRPKSKSQSPSFTSLPLQSALSSHLERPPSPTLLWLIRTCQTSAHELGHCFGLDHCVYYACCMQGSASLIEDARQPPYLCPVCAEKMLSATEAESETRMGKLMEVAVGWGWGALQGWCRGVLEVAERQKKDVGTKS